MKKIITFAVIGLLAGGIMTSCTKKQESASSAQTEKAIQNDEKQDLEDANAYMVDVKGDTTITNANGTKSVVTLDTMTPVTTSDNN